MAQFMTSDTRISGIVDSRVHGSSFLPYDCSITTGTSDYPLDLSIETSSSMSESFSNNDINNSVGNYNQSIEPVRGANHVTNLSTEMFDCPVQPSYEYNVEQYDPKPSDSESRVINEKVDKRLNEIQNEWKFHSSSTEFLSDRLCMPEYYSTKSSDDDVFERVCALAVTLTVNNDNTNGAPVNVDTNDSEEIDIYVFDNPKSVDDGMPTLVPVCYDDVNTEGDSTMYNDDDTMPDLKPEVYAIDDIPVGQDTDTAEILVSDDNTLAEVSYKNTEISDQCEAANTEAYIKLDTDIVPENQVNDYTQEGISDNNNLFDINYVKTEEHSTNLPESDYNYSPINSVHVVDTCNLGDKGVVTRELFDERENETMFNNSTETSESNEVLYTAVPKHTVNEINSTSTSDSILLCSRSLEGHSGESGQRLLECHSDIIGSRSHEGQSGKSGSRSLGRKWSSDVQKKLEFLIAKYRSGRRNKKLCVKIPENVVERNLILKRLRSRRLGKTTRVIRITENGNIMDVSREYLALLPSRVKI